MTGSSPPGGVLGRLNQASSAEDFFTLLGVAYDPKVVNVARLHILRRMAQYLASEDFEGAPDADVAARCKSVLVTRLCGFRDVVAARPARVQGAQGRGRPAEAPQPRLARHVEMKRR